MDSYRRLLRNKLQKELKLLNSLWKDTSSLSKSPEESERARKIGNDLYRGKHHTAETHREIFKRYCESVMCAPLESEPLALALGNRSAFLFHIQKYEECIQDIDRAVKMIKSNELKVKWLCRKVECLKKLGSSEYQEDLDEIDDYVDQINDDKTKRQLMELLKSAKALPTRKEETSSNENGSKLVDCLSKKNDILEQIEVRHSEKYGRYAIATKDYKPGDIIFVEDLYATIIVSARACISCHYCLRTAWAGIPCDECVWAIFCSEDCKRKAWTEFHDIECSVVPYIRKYNYESVMTEDSLRLIVLGLKECGSVGKLREELQSVDACTDAVRKGFYKDGKLSSNTIRSIYSLKGNGYSDDDVETILYMHSIPSTLVGLVKCRHFPNYNVKNFKELMDDDDLMFLGALLIKFIVVSALNSFNYHYNYKCEVSEKVPESSEKCCRRAVGVAPFASLINHSCFPNSHRFFTDDRKIVIYAVLPIKKNSQIFTTYGPTFFEVRLLERQEELSAQYAFQCDCVPCIKRWLSGSEQPPSDDEGFRLQAVLKPYENILQIVNSLASIRYDKETVANLCTDISKTFKDFNQPPQITYLGLTHLLDLYYARTLAFQPESFGECDKFSK